MRDEVARGDACALSDGGQPPLALYLSRQFLPLEDRVLIADWRLENVAFVAAYANKPLSPVSRAELLSQVRGRYGGTLVELAIHGLARRFPELSAQRVITHGQSIILYVTLLGVAEAFMHFPGPSWRLFVIAMTIGFCANNMFRVWLTLMARQPSAPALSNVALPTYTIVAPLYHEAAVLPDLVRSLLALDYPRDRLDIKLVVEQDDPQTVAAAQALAAGEDVLDVIVVPSSDPRTKPKAANYALTFARGEYLVVYDAEDRPEPDQLKKAVATFRASSRDTACLQARLTIFNAQDGWLPTMFALDYALWFGSLLPGLDRIGVPMPLGGTSNHFRTAVLRDIGGWDSFNVTEDADIGIRLAQMGYRVSMLDSATFEEAPIAVIAWLKQRSRWLKGYMQTWLVHMRDPAALMRRTGFKGFMAFQLFIGGGVLFALTNPLLWGVFLGTLLWRAVTGVHTPSLVIPGAGLLTNNVLLTYLAVMVPRRRGWDALAPYGLTVIVYWALASVAGYRGVWQLIKRPFYWDKTTHGVARK